MFLGIIVQVLWCSYVFTVTNLLQLVFSHLSFCNSKSSTAKKSLVFAARQIQIANILSPIAKKLYLHFFGLRIISLKRTSNNLACSLQWFLCLFCARFAVRKIGLLNWNLNKTGLKNESFLQKKAKRFFLFFLRPSSKVTNFNTSPMPLPLLFENFSLDTLNSEQKPVKIPVDRAGQKPVDRPVNRRWF